MEDFLVATEGMLARWYSFSYTNWEWKETLASTVIAPCLSNGTKCISNYVRQGLRSGLELLIFLLLLSKCWDYSYAPHYIGNYTYQAMCFSYYSLLDRMQNSTKGHASGHIDERMHTRGCFLREEGRQENLPLSLSVGVTSVMGSQRVV